MPAESTHGPVDVNKVMGEIRNKTAPAADRPTGTPVWEQSEKKVTGTPQSSELKNMLNKFKKSE
jgi:hypothetical protein